MLLAEILIGLCIGLVLGLTGAGGSVFAVPLIVLGLGLPTNDAIGISLGAVAASSALGVVTHFKERNSTWLPALFFALGGMLFAPLGRILGAQVDNRLLLLLFSLLALVIAVRMWQQSSSKDVKLVRALVDSNGSNKKESSPPLCRFNPINNGQYGPFRLKRPCVQGMIISGIGVGLMSGFFGVGGGFLIIPALMLITDMTMKQTVSVSLLVIFLISSSAFTTFLLSGMQVPIHTLATIAAGGLFGMLLGTLLARYLAGATLQRVFAISIVILSSLSIATLL